MLSNGRLRRRLRLRGAVQGVGYRPFVYRLANELGLSGYVANDPGGVTIEAEGSEGQLDAFQRRVVADAPPAARPELVSATPIDAAGDLDFAIRKSEHGGAKTAVLLADLATCRECAAEIADPANRRYRYPFTNCTNCGPRFSIIRGLPYDRPQTTMSGFAMCEQCQREYDDPLDRRFHAQPNACPQCGPHLVLTDRSGRELACHDEALQRAASALRAGEVLALKGLGGFHLMVDAANPKAVSTLRERKARWEKPLAVMVPSLDIAAALVDLDDEAVGLLTSADAPIVLLARRDDAPIAAEVAPDNPWLGVMLPYTPLHQLLLAELDRPVVATSGNLSDEPIAIDNDEARGRLGDIADAFLVHNRPIVRQVDDSVIQFVAGAPQPLRRSRGYAPRPVRLARKVPPILAVGPHQKNTVALAVGDEVLVSQHIGDLRNAGAAEAHERVIRDLLGMYDVTLAAVAHDMHPDYSSTRWAQENQLAPLVPVQHHHAHLAAVLAEHRIDEPVLGVTWDGTGYGTDGTIWGGEFLLGNAASYERVAHLRPLRLPGGDTAVKEPRRTAFALLHEAGWIERARHCPTLKSFSATERRVIEGMLDRDVNCPFTTSMGRLFDAVASLAGVRHHVAYEGQAAMSFEWAARLRPENAPPFQPYPMRILDNGIAAPLVLDWQPLLDAVLLDAAKAIPTADMSRAFHEGLARSVVALAERLGQRHTFTRVALTGGCFQNRFLTERTQTLLEAAGFQVLLNRKVPPNDGGVALGQVAVAAAALVR